ncbi:phosphoribosylformylglycinamidine synthase, partial [Coemansia sp. RSA 2611]
YPFPIGAITRIQTRYAHFIDFAPLYAAALSEYTPAVAEVLLPTALENRVSDNQDPDFEKLELADRERELWMLLRRGIISPWSSKATVTFGLCGLGDIVQRMECGIVYCIEFDDDLAIPQFRLSEHKQLNNAESDRMAEPSRATELAQPIRNIEATQAQGGAEKNKSATFSVLVWANRELGLTLAADEIAYLVDVYLDTQAT